MHEGRGNALVRIKGGFDEKTLGFLSRGDGKLAVGTGRIVTKARHRVRHFRPVTHQAHARDRKQDLARRFDFKIILLGNRAERGVVTRQTKRFSPRSYIGKRLFTYLQNRPEFFVKEHR